MEKSVSADELLLDTIFATHDVVSLKIFILAEPIAAFVSLTMNKHHGLFQ